jgi:hypothetical protein
MVPVPSSLSRKSTHVSDLHDTMKLTCHSAKKQVTDQGGKIEHEFKLVKGFTYDSIQRHQMLSLD